MSANQPIELDIEKTVKKNNVLNEIRNANATLVEYRLFCVYLAHLPINKEDNVVTFLLSDYARIVGLDRPRYADLKAQANDIVGITCTLENPEEDGFSTYSLFSEFRLKKDPKIGRYMVTLECNPKLAPMIREQKGKFLRYKLYNTIFLKSFNQQRIYELLKQYEKIGKRTIKLADLREFLSIKEKEYPVWYDFSSKVLKVAQKALAAHTDICFDYEPIKIRVKNTQKVDSVQFMIRKNKDFVDRLKVDQFLVGTGLTDGSDYGFSDEEVIAHAPDVEETARMIKVQLLNGEWRWIEKDLLYEGNFNCYQLNGETGTFEPLWEMTPELAAVFGCSGQGDDRRIEDDNKRASVESMRIHEDIVTECDSYDFLDFEQELLKVCRPVLPHCINEKQALALCLGAHGVLTIRFMGRHEPSAFQVRSYLRQKVAAMEARPEAVNHPYLYLQKGIDNDSVLSIVPQTSTEVPLQRELDADEIEAIERLFRNDEI